LPMLERCYQQTRKIGPRNMTQSKPRFEIVALNLHENISLFWQVLIIIFILFCFCFCFVSISISTNASVLGGVCCKMEDVK
jgi:hypothetical protein